MVCAPLPSSISLSVGAPRDRQHPPRRRPRPSGAAEASSRAADVSVCPRCQGHTHPPWRCWRRAARSSAPSSTTTSAPRSSSNSRPWRPARRHALRRLQQRRSGRRRPSRDHRRPRARLLPPCGRRARRGPHPRAQPQGPPRPQTGSGKGTSPSPASSASINTSRGGLVDTIALIEALKSGATGAAGLDVYEEEGDYFFEDHSDAVITDDLLARLMTFNNVLITSHQAFLTE